MLVRGGSDSDVSTLLFAATRRSGNGGGLRAWGANRSSSRSSSGRGGGSAALSQLGKSLGLLRVQGGDDLAQGFSQVVLAVLGGEESIGLSELLAKGIVLNLVDKVDSVRESGGLENENREKSEAHVCYHLKFYKMLD